MAGVAYKKNCLVLSLLSIFSFEAMGYDSDTAKAVEASARVEQEAHVESASGAAVSHSSSSSVNPVSVSGFYGGIGLGIDSAKFKFKNEKAYDAASSESDKKAAKKSKSKAGFLGDVFAGYNCQFGRFVLGLECSVGMRTAKSEADLKGASENFVPAKKKYSFGITPKIGYAIWDGFFGYVNVGTVLSKFRLNNNNKTKSTTSSKHPTKAAMLLGLGVEQNFGPLFVRGECNKVFDRNIGTLDGVKTSSSSYTFKIGGGYRF